MYWEYYRELIVPIKYLTETAEVTIVIFCPDGHFYRYGLNTDLDLNMTAPSHYLNQYC